MTAIGQRPKLLDLFCGAGGAAMGYYRAGFDVTGVDILPQPHYPFEFCQSDAFSYLSEFPWDWNAIHASPPCQDYSKAMRKFTAPGQYPRLIDDVREQLQLSGLPWVIENVPGAPLPSQADLFGANGVELCGSMFGLRFYRHRLFETSFPVTAPRGCDHSVMPMNPHNAKARREWRDRAAEAGVGIERMWQDEMDLPWMHGNDERREAIPPAYTEHIGRQLLDVLTASEVAP